VLSPGVLEWDEHGRVVSLRRARGAVEDVAVLPGLVNAHAHLQLEPLGRREPEFVRWVGAVMAQRGDKTPAQLRATARDAMQQLLRDGATAVGEIDSTGVSNAALRALPVTGRCYRELTGFHLRGAAARALVRQRWPVDGAGLRPALSPHAPYSVSDDLLRAALTRARHVAIHCAELPEEQRFLRDGDGPFAELLRRLGRLPDDFRARGCGAVRWLERCGALRPGTQLVHCQELERGDAARIAANGCSIVVCPGTIDYFGRTPPPVDAWLRRGIPVGLGTDSRASNAGWSMRHELQRAAALWPQLSPSQLLAMATAHGGRALGVAAGALRRGGRADFVAVRASSDWAATLAAFVHGAAQLERVVVGGRRVKR